MVDTTDGKPRFNSPGYGRVEPKIWNNEQRNRYYGLCRGDWVRCKMFAGPARIGKVVEFGFGDNNCVYLEFSEGGERVKWTAEHAERLYTVSPSVLKALSQMSDRYNYKRLDILLSDEDLNMCVAEGMIGIRHHSETAERYERFVDIERISQREWTYRE